MSTFVNHLSEIETIHIWKGFLNRREQQLAQIQVEFYNNMVYVNMACISH